MEITTAAKTQTKRGRAELFTGNVWQDALVVAPEPARVRALRVSFEPGARTFWHTHPLGQALHIISGVGRVQVWGGSVHEVVPGDTVWFEPGEKHWHGAAPEAAMVHLALQEALDGVTVEPMEEVSQENYLTKPAP